MCLAVPGKLVERKGNKGIVDFQGLKREADLSLMDEVKIGDYVLVHAGFVIQTVDEKAARETYGLLAEIFGADDGPVREENQ